MSCGCDTDNHTLDHNALKEIADNADIRILAIGNSFTENSTHYVPQLLTRSPDNSKRIFFARIVQGGCSLEKHWENHMQCTPAYSFSFADANEWVNIDATTFDAALDLTQWDIIVLQQVSGLSGLPESYHPYIERLSRLIRERRPNAAIGWQMTWAYASKSTHLDFAKYGNNRSEMFDAIVHTLDEVTPYVDFIIPSGTLIERIRSSPYNDSMDLTIDGYHLNQGMPCLALSCLWHEIIIAPYNGSIIDSKNFAGTVSMLCSDTVPFTLIAKYIHELNINNK